MDAPAATRTRTVSWSPPAALADAALEMDGLAFMRGIVAGDVPPPPVAEVLGFDVVEADRGTCTFRLEPGEHHYNPLGTVHGGVLATLADSAMGCAVYSTLGPGETFTTLELKVNYVRAATVDTGTIVCRGELVHIGRRTAVAQARVEDASGRLLANATCTCLVVGPGR